MPTHARVTLVVAVLLAALAGCTGDSDDDAGDAAATTTAADTTNATSSTSEQASAPVPPTDFEPIEDITDVPRLVRDVSPSVVAVFAGQGEGSGVVWDADGHVVTNAHVVADATDLEVAFADGRRLPAEVVATDRLVDLAVLETGRSGTPPAVFSDELPDVGELTVAIGNPLGFENSVTVGVVSGLHRQIPGSAAFSQSLVDLIQTDAAISPGNSGGAVVGADGRVLGISVAFIPPQGGAVSLGFAIPASTVTDVVGQLLAEGTVEHAYAGLVPAPVTPEVAQRFDLTVTDGVLVADLEAGGPAARAGLRPGDLIVAADGEPLRTVEDLLARIRQAEPGDTLQLELLREGTERRVAVVLGERPS